MQLPKLTETQILRFQDHSMLHLPGALSVNDARLLSKWVDETETWSETPGQWMKYFELSECGERRLCRVEHFIEFHDGLNELICGDESMSSLQQLMGEAAVLFKEKINFKLPGGKGFKAHQDAPAFQSFGPDYHITMMVSVDDTNSENGGLEFAEWVRSDQLLDQSSDLTLDTKLESGLNWYPLNTQAGDVLFFDSFIPHRSGPNRSTKSRRVLYITYNRKLAGDVRDTYYSAKRQAFPPDCERKEGVDYSKRSGQFNVGNPIN
jgi:2-aminoethylphosphonate dioxygenase